MEWKTGRHNRQDLKKEHSQHFFMITDNRLIVFKLYVICIKPSVSRKKKLKPLDCSYNTEKSKITTWDAFGTTLKICMCQHS